MAHSYELVHLSLVGQVIVLAASPHLLVRIGARGVVEVAMMIFPHLLLVATCNQVVVVVVTTRG